jgi:hypothetical protein
MFTVMNPRARKVFHHHAGFAPETGVAFFAVPSTIRQRASAG